ncbi:MAG: hypothetical protein H6668_05450 [Ardenticatenaceae bacterium]|nr:hypothetical protein [Ardenticatenaceae bacterium]
MSRNTKIVLIVLGVLLATCCIITVAFMVIIPMFVTRVASDSVVEGDAAADVGQEIVDYELPSGYKEEGGVQILGMRMVFIVPEGGSGQMMALMQFPSGIPINDEDMRQQMQDAIGQQAGRQGNVAFAVVATEQAVINGKPAVLTTLEGTDENGQTVRQIFGIFEAKNGSGAMVMVMGDEAGWDETAVNQFLASIRDDAGTGR